MNDGAQRYYRALRRQGVPKEIAQQQALSYIGRPMQYEDFADQTEYLLVTAPRDLARARIERNQETARRWIVQICWIWMAVATFVFINPRHPLDNGEALRIMLLSLIVACGLRFVYFCGRYAFKGVLWE